MISGTMAFVAGVILLQYQAQLPSLVFLCLLPILLLLARRFSLLRLPFFFCMGFFWALLHAHWQLSSVLEPGLEGVDVELQGVVSSRLEARGRSIRFLFDVESMVLDGVAYQAPDKVRLSWYGRMPELHVGERWSLLVRLKRPHGFMNPGGFDYEGWLFQQRIGATGYVRKSNDNRLLQREAWGYELSRWRQTLREKLEKKFGDVPAVALLAALVVGDRSGISTSQWETFARTGTSHLIAISGLHIGVVAGLVFFLVRALWGCSSRLSLTLPAPQAAAFAALLVAVLYAVLAGFAIPTRRALAMLSVLMGGVLWRRQLRPARGLMLALLLVVVMDPMSVLSAGFWLSFAAVAVILMGMMGRLSQDGLWWKWGRVQWVVAIGLIPVLLSWQLQVSLVAPLVNLVAVPLVSLLLVPLALVGSLLLMWLEPVGAILLWPVVWLLNESVVLLDWVANWPLAAWDGAGVPFWAKLVAGVGVLLFLLPSGVPGRWLGGLFLLPGFFAQASEPLQDGLSFTLLDVGQGLAAVIQTSQHTLVYDAGPRFSERFDAGSSVVAPFLQQQGVGFIDRLILSNGDNDHAGGGEALAGLVPVGMLFSGEPERIGWRQALPCRAPMHWQWDGVDFHVLYPSSAELKGNNASCVLLVESGETRILLTGDIEKEGEALLLKEDRSRLQADLVLIPHHGSKTSSTSSFVRAVSPDYALAAVGYRNRYAFPRPDIVARWQGVGAQVLSTAGSGAIHFRIQGDGRVVGPEQYRLSYPHYWAAR